MRLGLLLLCLLPCAISCGVKREVVTAPKVLVPEIPEHLTLPTDQPDCAAKINGDLVRCVRDLRTALDQANADKAAIRRTLDNTEEQTR